MFSIRLVFKKKSWKGQTLDLDEIKHSVWLLFLNNKFFQNKDSHKKKIMETPIVITIPIQIISLLGLQTNIIRNLLFDCFLPKKLLECCLNKSKLTTLVTSRTSLPETIFLRSFSRFGTMTTFLKMFMIFVHVVSCPRENLGILVYEQSWLAEKCGGRRKKL